MVNGSGRIAAGSLPPPVDSAREHPAVALDWQADLSGGDRPGYVMEQAAEQLSALRDAGVARVMCQQLLHEDLDAAALLGEALAPQVA